MEAFIGSIILFAGNFAPRGWAFCDGRLLAIAQNTALFSILGTTYGGDGITTFALPDLRGRVPVHAGNGSQGPGLEAVQLGEAAGTNTTTLLTTNMPAHNHTLAATTNAGDSSNPEGAVLAGFGTDAPPTGPYSTGPANTILAVNAVGVSGGTQPFSIMQPYLGLNYIIALEGIFPSQW